MHVLYHVCQKGRMGVGCRLVSAECEAAYARAVLHQQKVGGLHPTLLLCMVSNLACRLAFAATPLRREIWQHLTTVKE